MENVITINNEQELDYWTQHMLMLCRKGELSEQELFVLDKIGDMVEAYEKEHYSIEITLVDIVRHEMRERGLTQKKLDTVSLSV